MNEKYLFLKRIGKGTYYIIMLDFLFIPNFFPPLGTNISTTLDVNKTLLYHTGL